MLRTAEQYRAGLVDGREVWYRGRRVADVTADPELRLAVDHSALAYDLARERPDLAVHRTEDGREESAYYLPPRTPEDVARRGRLIEEGSRRGAGTIVLKEVGSDALFALLATMPEGPGLENAQAFWRRCVDGDLALAVAQTDVKGDRSAGPTAQQDPDLYLRVVDEDAESITVRGAKCHTSFSANADEVVVLPTRAMGPDAADYAVSFAIPADTPGLGLYVSSYSAYGGGSATADGDTAFEFPLASRHKLLETLTVFDDVRVPRDRVFLCREPAHAGPLALAFTQFHRYTAVSYKLPLLDQLVGAAVLVAEANGISRASHVKDKLSTLIGWAETVRGLGDLAAARAGNGGRGIHLPDPGTVNLAKYHFAHGYTEATAIVRDLAGGLLATGPGAEDWAAPEVRKVLEKYYAGAVPAEERLRIINFISDLTVRDYGGYQTVLATHAEGSLEAEKMQILRSYDRSRAVEYTKDLAGLH